MKFNKNERQILFKAIKIMQAGEELLGLDIDKKIVDGLAGKIQKELDVKSIKEINKRITALLKEAKEAGQFPDYNEDEEGDEEEYFDREFGPNYAYSDTLKILNQAIKNNQLVEINYYSTNQSEFTKRRIKPGNIERQNGTPYLNAFCYLRKADRVFKLNRIKNIKIVGVTKK